MASTKVLIAGGGISGLTLAQGLVREGVECQVFERDPLERWRTGYLLNLDVEGDRGLEACLSADLYELFLRACGQTMSGHDQSVVLDPMGNKLTSMPHFGEVATGDRPPTNIDRRTLRQILLAGLDDVVRHGAEVADVEVSESSVTLVLADGSRVEGDVLVAADGVGSAVRRRLMPQVEIIPSPVGALGLFGRSPLTQEIASELPEAIWDAGFAIISDGRGTMLGVGHWDPRQPVAHAAADLGIPGSFHEAEPYFMLNGAIPPGVEVPPPAEWTEQTPALMHATMITAVSGWHPALSGLVERIDPATLFSHPFRRLDPTPPWTTSRVTYLGDAITAMLPTLGKGANMSMRNAAALRDQLLAADRGERELLAALAAYEQEMRAATYPLMEIAADHNRFGGGGLRGPAEAEAQEVQA
jgi:2-polyprenyl-6-methoxyphenol hydroxylase-like FAD-dependent oxidoreductase